MRKKVFTSLNKRLGHNLAAFLVFLSIGSHRKPGCFDKRSLTSRVEPVNGGSLHGDSDVFRSFKNFGANVLAKGALSKLYSKIKLKAILLKAIVL